MPAEVQATGFGFEDLSAARKIPLRKSSTGASVTPKDVGNPKVKIDQPAMRGLGKNGNQIATTAAISPSHCVADGEEAFQFSGPKCEKETQRCFRSMIRSTIAAMQINRPAIPDLRMNARIKGPGNGETAAYAIHSP